MLGRCLTHENNQLVCRRQLNVKEHVDPNFSKCVWSPNPLSNSCQRLGKSVYLILKSQFLEAVSRLWDSCDAAIHEGNPPEHLEPGLEF